MSPDESIEMNVGGLTLDPATKSPIVVLRDAGNTVNLPIWIGLLEATAIATELEGIEMARPMTHDLLRDMIGELGGRVERVEINDLRDNTYYARIHIRTSGGPRVIDSRPSDAISLAFWINGTDSAECCAFSGGPFVESRYFGEGIGIAVRKGNDILRQSLNWALFRVWEKGRYTDLWLRYFSISPF